MTILKEVMNVINLNKMAKDITLSEGLKKSVSIAQVKEVMRLVFQSIKKMTVDDINGILKRTK